MRSFIKDWLHNDGHEIAWKTEKRVTITYIYLNTNESCFSAKNDLKWDICIPSILFELSKNQDLKGLNSVESWTQHSNIISTYFVQCCLQCCKMGLSNTGFLINNTHESKMINKREQLIQFLSFFIFFWNMKI